MFTTRKVTAEIFSIVGGIRLRVYLVYAGIFFRKAHGDRAWVTLNFLQADLWIASILVHLLAFFQRAEPVGMYDE